MGSSPSKHEEAFTFTSPKIFSETEKNYHAMFESSNTNVEEVTCFSSRSLEITEKLRLTIEGAGVIRIGISEKDPRVNRDISKDPLFEIEDGFDSSETSSRVLYINVADDICYGPTEEDYMEYAPSKDLTTSVVPVFLYVTFVYGRPVISAVHKEESVELIYNEGSLLKTIDGGKVTVSKIPNIAIMRLLNPIALEACYHINWTMMLSTEKIGDRPPKHGFLRIGLVSGDITDLEAFSINTTECPEEDNTSWFTESAVVQYPYSGVIGLIVKSQEICHNLTVNSVGTIVKERMRLNPKQPIYLVIEASSGGFTASAGSGYSVKQNLMSSTYLVNDFREFTTQFEAELYIKSSLGIQPYLVQYGPHPRKVVIMFNKRLTNADVTKMREVFDKGFENLPDTDTVQVLYDTSDDKRDSGLHSGNTDKIRNTLRDAFERPQQTGGGEIKGMDQLSSKPECWRIQYLDAKDARRVWMRKELCIEGTLITVLPWFKDLGPAINFGKPPVVDCTDLTISDLDQEKLGYVIDRKDEKDKFERHIANQIPISIKWPQPDGFEKESDQISITISLHVEDCRFELRPSWKHAVRTKIESYFASDIITKDIKVKKHNYEAARRTIQRHPDNQRVICTPDRSSCTIRLICSDKKLLDDLVNQIHDVDKTRVHITEKMSLDKYIYYALEDEGKLTSVARENQNTRFIVTEHGDIKLSGPREEVDRAKNTITELAVKTSKLSEEISRGEEKLFKTESGRRCLKEALQKQKLSKHYNIDGGFCKLYIYVENERDGKRKAKLFSNILHGIFTERSIPITKDMREKSLAAFIQQTEADDVSIEIDDKTANLIVRGTDTRVKDVEEAMKRFLHREPLVTRSVGLPFEVVEYMGTLLSAFQTKPYEIRLDEAKPSVTITATEKEVDGFENDLWKEAKSIKTHWFYISRPWLIFEGKDIDNTKRIVNAKCNCVVEIQHAHSLSTSNVRCIAINSGAAYTSICCDLTKTPVDAIIVPLYTTSLSLSAGISRSVAEAGGRPLIDGCISHVTESGQLNYGDIVMMGSGNIPCQTIAFVCLNKGEDGRDTKKLGSTVTACLEAVQKRHFKSVLIPVAALCSRNKESNDMEEILKSLSEFIPKNQNGTLKEIGLCDRNLEMVGKMATWMTSNLKSPWFVFNDLTIKPLQEEAKQVPARPLSSKGRRRQGDDTIMWGKERFTVPNPNDSNDEEEIIEEGAKPKFTPKSADTGGGLPFTIKLSDGVELQIQKGELQKSQVDVIVNPTPMFPGLTGAVSNALLQAGGDAIKTECEQHGSITSNDVMVSNPGNLACKHVYHVLQPMKWNSDTGFDEVYNIVWRCLETANRNNVSSIAFPAIGTGASHFPAHTVTEAMMKAMFEFVAKFNSSSVKNVAIVLFYKDSGTVKAFADTVLSLIAVPKDAQKGKKGKASRDGIPERRRKQTVSAPKVRPVKHSAKDDVLFVKITLKGNIKDATELFKEQIDSIFVKKEVKYDLEDNLNNEEERSIKQLESKGIGVSIDRTKQTVTLDGLKTRVEQAEMKLIQLIQLDFASTRDYNRNVRRVCDVVQWFYEDTNGDLKEIDDVSNVDIHLAYLAGEDFTYYNNAEKKKYRVLIAPLEEHPETDSTKRRRLVLRQKIEQGLTVPDDWSIKTNGKDRDMIRLSETSQEYDDVKRKFIADGCKPTSIESISKIEDRYKYLQYKSKEIQLEKQNPTGTLNERQLWHGTDGDTYLKIIKHGFDRNFRGKNAVKFGNGVYFAVRSNYSDGYARPDGAGIRRMFLAKVLTGAFCQGIEGMSILPLKTKVDGVNVNFDSAVDKLASMNMFVIFHDTQAYPEYLIEYKR